MQALSARVAAVPAKAVQARRQTVVCSAQQQQVEVVPRRAALALAVAAVLGLTAQAAEANQAQAKSATRASMAGYGMEGTKHQGISSSRRAKLLAKVRKAAGKQ